MVGNKIRFTSHNDYRAVKVKYFSNKRTFHTLSAILTMIQLLVRVQCFLVWNLGLEMQKSQQLVKFFLPVSGGADCLEQLFPRHFPELWLACVASRGFEQIQIGISELG